VRRAIRHDFIAWSAWPFYSITALAATITFTTNLSGTPAIGQTLWIGRATLSGHQIFNVTSIIGASVSLLVHVDQAEDDKPA
jgi:hypothetical protein